LPDPKLNQILAIEKGVKTHTYNLVTELHKATQKSALMNGFLKSYEPKNEDGETYPPESQRVQYEHVGVLRSITKSLTELFDVTATKDWTNCVAKADVVVDGKTLLSDVPATYLLFLEKQLSDLHTFVSKMVELDSNNAWVFDEATGLYKTPTPVTTQRTKKVQRAIVLYDATEHHPAQTQLISEDQVVGSWVTQKVSGAIPKTKKDRILERIDLLTKAVKFAREKANSIKVVELLGSAGDKVFSYLFDDDKE
jgi:hypothetical protein